MKQKSIFKNKNIYNPNCYINPKRYKRSFRPANNSQVKYKKIILIKNCMTNKPFQNTNDYKIWIF